MARGAAKAEQSEIERKFGEALRMADPDMAAYVAAHEALLERVIVLERALEWIASHPHGAASVIAQEALANGSS